MKKNLYFKEDGTFKILQFTDIHFTEDDETDRMTTELMNDLIQAENPDFIICTGDTVYGPENVTHLEKSLRPIIVSGIPWSFVFGNHDTEEGESHEILYPQVLALPNCIAYEAEETISGTGNYYLEIKDEKEDIKWVLFGMDSGDYNALKSVAGYDYVKKDQMAWYQGIIRKMEQKNPDFSALLFMHMALPEYHELWDMEICYGEKLEGIGCPRINSGFFTAMLEAGHMRGVFVGHDHINDFYGTLYGITLGYGRATGYHTYGEDGYLRGARIFELNKNNTETFETYVRLSDGSVIKKPTKHKPERIRDEG